MEILLNVVAAITAAVTTGLDMFKTIKSSDAPNLPVKISTQTLINKRGDTVVFFRIESVSDQQLIVQQIAPKSDKIGIRYGPSNVQANSLDQYVEDCILTREETRGVDRFFPPRISSGNACHGYLVLSGGLTCAEFVVIVQKANSKRPTKIMHQASLAPPLAAVQITSADHHAP